MDNPIIRVEIGKAQLLELQSEERVFFIALGHLQNEIDLLNKLGYWAANPETSSDAEGHGQYALSLILRQLVAGKLNEGWRLIETHYYGNKISKKYAPFLNDECSDQLNGLKNYFKDGNSKISNIRNNFAFHNSPDEIDRMLPDINEPMYVYVQREESRNSLYHMSEVLHGNALIRSIQGEKEGGEEKWDELVKEIYEVSALFLNFADCIMSEIIANSGIELRIDGPEEINVENMPNFEEVTIPWFTNV